MQYKFDIDKLTEPETVRFEAKNKNDMKKILIIIMLSTFTYSCSKDGGKVVTEKDCYSCNIYIETSSESKTENVKKCGITDESIIRDYMDSVFKLTGKMGEPGYYSRFASCEKIPENASCYECLLAVSYNPKNYVYTTSGDMLRDTIFKKELCNQTDSTIAKMLLYYPDTNFVIYHIKDTVWHYVTVYDCKRK